MCILLVCPNKSRDITLPTKVRLVKAMVFPVVMYGCESWTVKKAERWRIDAFELWCWRNSWVGRQPDSKWKRDSGLAPVLFSYPHSGSAQCHTAAEKAPGIKPGKASKTRTWVQVPAESNKPTATAGLGLDVLKVPWLFHLLRTRDQDEGRFGFGGASEMR